MLVCLAHIEVNNSSAYPARKGLRSHGTPHAANLWPDTGGDTVWKLFATALDTLSIVATCMVRRRGRRPSLVWYLASRKLGLRRFSTPAGATVLTHSIQMVDWPGALAEWLSVGDGCSDIGLGEQCGFR